MNNIKVSIIVPVYNVEEYLPRCLDSLVNQTLKDIEIICINDKSPDNSIQILRDYEGKYPDLVKVINSKVNLRQGGARNLGIKASQGEYLGFVDSDDWVHLDMYEKLYAKTTNSKYEIVYSEYQKALTTEGPFEIIKRNEGVDWNSDINIIRKNFIVDTNPVWSGIYSRTLFFDYNIYFPEKLFYEDNYIVPLLVAYADNIRKVNEPLINYNIGNVSVTRSFNNENYFHRQETAKTLLFESRKRNLINYKDEIEYNFIKLFYINTSIGCLTKFFPIRFKELLGIREEIVDILPNYMQNKYLISRINNNRKFKIYMNILNNFPYLLPILYQPRSFVKSLKLRSEKY